MGWNVQVAAVLTLAEARTKRRQSASRKPIDAEDAALQAELDDVLTALIWKLRKSPPGEDPAGLN